MYGKVLLKLARIGQGRRTAEIADSDRPVDHGPKTISRGASDGKITPIPDNGSLGKSRTNKGQLIKYSSISSMC